MNIPKIDFEKLSGLVPAVVQDEKTKEILMVGFQNAEAVQHSLQSGYVVFYSRSKKRLWMKGESSKNRLKIRALYLDCDRDTLLWKVEAPPTTCHQGSFSCFSLWKTF